MIELAKSSGLEFHLVIGSGVIMSTIAAVSSIINGRHLRKHLPVKLGSHKLGRDELAGSRAIPKRGELI